MLSAPAFKPTLEVRPTVGQSVLLAQSVLTTMLVLIKNVSILARELVDITQDVKLSTTVQFAAVLLVKLEILSEDALKIYQIQLLLKKEIRVCLVHVDRTLNVPQIQEHLFVNAFQGT